MPFVGPFGTAGVPIAVVEGYVDFHAWSDDGRSIYFVRANRTIEVIEVIDVNANGEPVGPPRVVVPTSTLEVCGARQMTARSHASEGASPVTRDVPVPTC